MRHFLKIGEFDPLPLLMQLERNPHLWNENRDRKERDKTAHAAMDDIWIRYRARDELKTDQDFQEPHFPVWYPSYHQLPALRPIILSIMAKTEATALGGCLITRVPPGGKILPHSDKGSWHPEYYHTKVYAVLKSNDRCVNYCEDEALAMRAGEVWIFNNLKMHAVENDGNDDRITLIISLRCE